ncbi:UDP-2,3-diacylglucosamine diphosphatase [Xylophilus rhododendri]|uniref:UDP-2,3-diacylglucosamine hydrolase n=2 Tax=Xylophilus rhododendri TaxID=2697032 RepID=A0A857JDU0_9BURK|nr:UDP-2,3-diacylglucosamine diphosphatase [Xylophilus rhododendri]QHJ01362.1 UDP-2,3-diacylglucosamine diphosphatase [Xylophilus rhododendri]
MQALPSTVAAPKAWRTVDFISDLHLHEDDPATAAGFAAYLRDTPAQAVFLLGDIFEVWIGDDAAAAGSFEAGIGHLLREAANSRELFFLHGNRDFLVGEGFLREAGLTLLSDPCLLTLHGRRWLLSHGDALCLGDTDYQVFRAQVRSPEWQSNFLAKPLEERRAIACGLRRASEARKASDADYADADTALTQAWLTEADAGVLIHGHTHRPADHRLDDGRQRIVLSDWDLAAEPPRAQVLRIAPDGEPRRIALA